MIEITEKSNCCGCTACANKCPRNAIKMVEDDKGFLYPYIDRKKCINCGLCDKVCPIINKRKTENYPKAYAAINKDEKIRLNSSSGGIFSALANYILEEQGIIFGAAFSDDFLVKHIMIDNKDDLYKLRTSKYLQSSLGDIYKEVEKKLNEGKKVLFTGTSCQINGLYGYLNKIYENLYTQDIICHGVPSPKVWKNYLKYRQEKDLESPTKINFREKTIGWIKKLEKYLPSDACDKLMKLTEKVPASHTLLHADFHLKNILVTGDELMLIDMDTLCAGDPIFEIATIYNSYMEFPSISPMAAKFLGIDVETANRIWERTIKLYTEYTGEDEKEITRKAQILGCIRILDYADRQPELPDRDLIIKICTEDILKNL